MSLTPEEIAARKAAWDAGAADRAARAARKHITRDPNDNKPVTHGDLNALLDALADQGIIIT